MKETSYLFPLTTDMTDQKC